MLGRLSKRRLVAQLLWVAGSGLLLFIMAWFIGLPLARQAGLFSENGDGAPAPGRADAWKRGGARDRRGWDAGKYDGARDRGGGDVRKQGDLGD